MLAIVVAGGSHGGLVHFWFLARCLTWLLVGRIISHVSCRLTEGSWDEHWLSLLSVPLCSYIFKSVWSSVVSITMLFGIYLGSIRKEQHFFDVAMGDEGNNWGHSEDVNDVYLSCFCCARKPFVVSGCRMQDAFSTSAAWSRFKHSAIDNRLNGSGRWYGLNQWLSLLEQRRNIQQFHSSEANGSDIPCNFEFHSWQFFSRVRNLWNSIVLQLWNTALVPNLSLNFEFSPSRILSSEIAV